MEGTNLTRSVGRGQCVLFFFYFSTKMIYISFIFIFIIFLLKIILDPLINFPPKPIVF